MKHHLLTTLLLVSCMVTAQAKTAYRSARTTQKNMTTTKFGTKLGPTSYFISHKNYDKNKIQDYIVTRLHANIFGEYQISEQLGTQLNLAYTQKGNKEQAETFDLSEIKIQTNYLLVATTLRYYPGSDKQFCLHGGSYAAYLIAAELIATIGDTKTQKIDLKQPKYKLNNLDFGLVIGLDYEFDMGLIVGLDYQIGLRNVADREGLKNKNRGTEFNVGYNFAKLMQ